MKPITILSLGPGSRDLLTLGTLNELKKARKVILRTGRSDAAEYLSENGIAFDTLDSLHDACDDFDELSARAAEAVTAAAEEEPVCYAVLDALNDESVRLLLKKTDCRVLPGVPVSAPFLCRFPSDNLLIQSASSLRVCDTQHDLLITELDSRMLAGECKLQLLSWYDPEDEAVFFAPSSSTERAGTPIRLEEMDRQKKYDHTCALLLPAAPLEKRRRFDFYDLVRIMDLLRSPGGCPWDREQTHASLRPYLIEESYETAEALDREDWESAADELGDVLLQVVFHAAVGKDDGSMELSEITSDICRKMIHRHAHVFGGDKCDTAEAVTENWNRIKQQDRGENRKGDALRHIPAGMEPLLRSTKALKKAGEAGFAPRGPLDTVQALREDLDRLDTALRAGRSEEIGELQGRILLDTVESCRQAGTDPEKALSQAANSFIKRFCDMENAIIADGKSLKDLTISEMVVYWKSCGLRD